MCAASRNAAAAAAVRPQRGGSPAEDWRGPRTGSCQAPAGGLARTHAPGRGHNRDTVSAYFDPRARRARSLGVVRGRRLACRPAAPD